jgi:chromosome segregation ATPase
MSLAGEYEDARKARLDRALAQEVAAQAAELDRLKAQTRAAHEAARKAEREQAELAKTLTNMRLYDQDLQRREAALVEQEQRLEKRAEELVARETRVPSRLLLLEDLLARTKAELEGI